MNTCRAAAFTLLAVLAVLAGCTAGAGGQHPRAASPLVPGPGDHTITLRLDGLQRRYHVHVPAQRTGRPFPVMLALHGGGGSGRQFQRENALDPVAEREGFLAVYPDGTGPLQGRLLTWNAGTHCCGWARTNAIDDGAFLRAVLDDLATRIAIDPGRIYVTGHSNGAMMAYRFAAENATRVTAIIPVAGAMDLDRFNPARPVAVLHIHSVDDPRALYDGGLGPNFPGTDHRVEHQPVTRGLADWARHNGCNAHPQVQSVSEGDGSAARQHATRLVYTGCRPGGAVEHLRLQGAGHGWPGVTTPRLRQHLLGPPTTLVNAAEEAWRFASRFARPVN